jgi:8-oxo-dGTP pyrophosphatase MutT (NUDIX family)
MPHIHTDPGQGDHTASAYIVLLESEQEPKMVLHMHKKLSMLLQFGGHVELTETSWTAVVHEVQEESGYRLNELQLLQPRERLKAISNASVLHPQPLLVSTHPFGVKTGHFHSDITYLFTATARPTHNPDANESNDLRYISQKELAELPAELVGGDVKDIGAYIFETILQSWEPVSPSEYSVELPQIS